jgi:hypothetical protein
VKEWLLILGTDISSSTTHQYLPLPAQLHWSPEIHPRALARESRLQQWQAFRISAVLYWCEELCWEGMFSPLPLFTRWIKFFRKTRKADDSRILRMQRYDPLSWDCFGILISNFAKNLWIGGIRRRFCYGIRGRSMWGFRRGRSCKAMTLREPPRFRGEAVFNFPRNTSCNSYILWYILTC